MRKLLFLAGVLLAGCRSEQVAFQFQAGTSAPVGMARPLPRADSVHPAAVVVAPPSAAIAPTPPLAQQRPHSPRTGAKRLLPVFTAGLIPVPAARQLAQHLKQRRTTEGAAEAGLGRIGLFFIGVVVAVLAGLAALVNLILGVGFFTALGYTAAALVVLGLLYLLLSSKK